VTGARTVASAAVAVAAAAVAAVTTAAVPAPPAARALVTAGAAMETAQILGEVQGERMPGDKAVVVPIIPIISTPTRATAEV